VTDFTKLGNGKGLFLVEIKEPLRNRHKRSKLFNGLPIYCVPYKTKKCTYSTGQSTVIVLSTTPEVNEVLGVQISMEKEKATVMEVDRNVSKADLYGQAAGS
jgi:ribosomal protein L25 (general stress protein Ctc)